jgi:hypothetical protein
VVATEAEPEFGFVVVKGDSDVPVFDEESS